MQFIPAAVNIASAIMLAIAGLVTLYALFVLAIASAFVSVRIHKLTNVLNAIFDFARWPAQVFEGFWKAVFTFLIPLAVVTIFRSWSCWARSLQPTSLLRSR
jgi:ABC-2 type transport system permease protein